jgi:lipopolysaccharide/colanic/teichoic acid biosynthesis glycosyltransferase
MSNNNNTILFIGNSDEPLYLLKAAFANSINIKKSTSLREVKEAVLSGTLKAVLTDCSNQSIELIDKIRNTFSRKELSVFVAALGNEDEAIVNEIRKRKVNGLFNIKKQARLFISILKSQSISKVKPKAKNRKGKQIKTPLDKRIFDILVSGLALLFLSPLFLIVIIAIKLEDKGPSIYLSKRVGTGYRIFNLIKFRSMYTDADKRLEQMKGQNMYAADMATEKIDIHNCPDCAAKGEPCSDQLVLDGDIVCERQYKRFQEQENAGVFMKFKDDPRITKVGKFIRNTSIDELPQLLNVFLGHMSLVGNRPLPLYEAEQLTADGYVERFLAPAGLTGLWQVTQRGKEVSEEERIELDNEYARNYSLWYDLKIIMKTFPALLQQENV